MNEPKKDTALTVKEIAADLRVSGMTIYRMIDRGEIRSFRVGRSIRVRVSDYRDYLRREASA